MIPRTCLKTKGVMLSKPSFPLYVPLTLWLLLKKTAGVDLNQCEMKCSGQLCMWEMWSPLAEVENSKVWFFFMYFSENTLLLLITFSAAPFRDPRSRSPSWHPIIIILCHTDPLHCKSSLWPSSFPSVGQFHIQHPLYHVSTIPLLHMSTPPQPCLSDIVSKLPNLRCPSLKLISNPSSIIVKPAF